MAIIVSRKPGIDVPKPSVEDTIKKQGSEIADLKISKIGTQLAIAELAEQTQTDKLELQLALAELCEQILPMSGPLPSRKR